MAEALSQADILMRRNRELGILNQIARALNREVDLERALHATLAQVADLLKLRGRKSLVAEERWTRPKSNRAA